MTKEHILSVGIIGLGWPGQRHAEAVLGCPKTRLAAVADLDEQRRLDFQERHEFGRTHADYQDILQSPDVDAVVVCLPNFLHFPVSLAALREGKHVLCEKPPTLNVKEMRELEAQARNEGLTYAFSRQPRFGERLQRARQLVQSGELGNIYHAQTSWMRTRGIPSGGTRSWFLAKDKAGGGAMIDIGIHALDNAWFVLGCPKPVSVTAHLGRYFAASDESLDTFDVDDTGFAFFRFEGGLTLQLQASWAANLPQPPTTSGNQRENFFYKTILLGDKAGLQYSPLTPQDGGVPFILNDGKTPEIWTDFAEDQAEGPGRLAISFGGQMDDFADAILEKRPPVNSTAQAMELMKMLDAVYESSAKEQEIHF